MWAGSLKRVSASRRSAGGRERLMQIQRRRGPDRNSVRVHDRRPRLRADGRVPQAPPVPADCCARCRTGRRNSTSARTTTATDDRGAAGGRPLPRTARPSGERPRGQRLLEDGRRSESVHRRARGRAVPRALRRTCSRWASARPAGPRCRYSETTCRSHLPAHAVVEDRAGRFVFVAEPDGDGLAAVRRRPVTVGAFAPGGLEVLKGLAEGDRVVVAGVNRLQDGDDV